MMFSSAMGTMFTLAGVGVAGGVISLVLQATGAVGLARLVEVGLVVVGVAVVAPMIFDLFSTLEFFAR